MGITGKPTDAPAEPSANFYSRDPAKLPDGDDLADAARLEGLDHEIAVLRVTFKEILRTEPLDHALVLRTAGVLIRAVVAQYRLSPRAGKNLTNHLTALLNDLGDQILPADR
jgi:hypothetical protein